MNEDIKKQAHSFLVEKGCKSMAENYPAYGIEQMLTEFAERQIKLFRQCNVSGQSELLIAKEQDAFDEGYTKGWTEGFNSGKVNGD